MGGDGLLYASPSTAGPVEHGPHERQAGAFAGEPADDLHPPAGLAEGAFDEVGVPDAAMVLSREPPVGEEVLEVVLEAVDRCRVELAPLRRECLRPAAGHGLRRGPGIGVEVVEDLPELGLDGGLGVGGRLGEDVAGSVDQATLPQRPPKTTSAAPIRPFPPSLRPAAGPADPVPRKNRGEGGRRWLWWRFLVVWAGCGRWWRWAGVGSCL